MGLGFCDIAHHRANVLIGRRVLRLGREVGKPPAYCGQMVVMHERFLERIQIARFPDDAFKGRRDGSRMAPESMEFPVGRRFAGHDSGQRRID